jgi:hypothetical protein
MTSAAKGADPTVTLAFWRKVDGGGIEFFVPAQVDQLVLTANSNAAAAARSTATERFGLNPRSNARTFEVAGQRVVAFSLTTSEAATIAEQGEWLLPRRMEEVVLSALLQDVATRL